MSTLFTVGNARYPMPRLLALAVSFASQLPQPVYVQHGHTEFESEDVLRFRFLSEDEFSECMASAGIIIMHGGAVSILQANQLGRIPIVMPRRRDFGEHIDNHQVSLCCHFAKAGKVVVLEESADLLHALARAKALETHFESCSSRSQMPELVAAAIKAAAGS